MAYKQTIYQGLVGSQGQIYLGTIYARNFDNFLSEKTSYYEINFLRKKIIHAKNWQVLPDLTLYNFPQKQVYYENTHEYTVFNYATYKKILSCVPCPYKLL